ncbi:unnamed protein product [Phaedon cochleariae]|uniref:Translational activator of cytochrome c oxidase 1 n=1 Tax=Phaedon cochleariae TaxID=80249 RepID=A0A9P0DUH6_PHACE|nr:unnamed protein product [Phaedon cochleariae]
MFRNCLKTFQKSCETQLLQAFIFKRFAGHSKWQNIKHIKGLKDAQKCQLFTKLGRQIKVAIHEGGSADVKLNGKLAQIVEQAKRANMPVATLQSIIKSCQNDKSQEKLHLLEIKGPGNCFIMCEVFTNQLHQLKMSIATILRKHGSKFSDGGGQHLFHEKALIEAEFPIDNSGDKQISEVDLLEQATEHAILSGAEDVSIMENNTMEFTCAETSLQNVVLELEKIGYKVASAGVEYLPLKFQKLQDSELELCGRLYEKLENLSEVVRLSDNIA